MVYQRIDTDNFMEILRKADSTLNGWDILCSFDAHSLNAAFLKEYQKFPEYNTIQIFSNKKILGHPYRISCDFTLGRPTITLSHAQSGVFDVEFPIETFSYCNKTYRNVTTNISIPQGHKITLSGSIYIAKETKGKKLFYSSNEIVNFGRLNTLSVVLRFCKSMKNVDVNPSSPTDEFNDIFDAIKINFVQSIKERDYEVARIIKSTDTSNKLNITPKELIFTTTANENERDGVFSIWIHVYETGNLIGNIQPSFYPNYPLLPVPKYHSKSIIFSKRLIEQVFLHEKSGQNNPLLRIDFSLLDSFTTNHFLMNENKVKVTKENGVYFTGDFVIIQDIVSRYEEMVKATLNERISKKCLPKKLVVQGKYVKFSDIAINECSNEIELIELFATEKVFVDTDFVEMCKKVQLSIVAPTWDILGRPKIKSIGTVLGVGKNFIEGHTFNIFTTELGHVDITEISTSSSISVHILDKNNIKEVPEKPFECFCKYKTDPLEFVSCNNPKINCSYLNTTQASFINPSFVINDYKNFVRENLNANLLVFLDEIERNLHIIDLYDTMGFVNEIQGLEDQFYRLQSKENLQTYYKSLLRRIYQYAAHPKYKERSMEYKKVLSYLYTATLSKICSLNNNYETDLIINLEKFFEIITDDLEELKELSNNVAINNYYRKYKDEITSQSKEAEYFISTKITTEINSVYEKLNNKIENLVNETIALQNETIKEKQKFKKQQEELQNSLIQRAIMAPLKIVGQFLGFLGPVGSAAGAAMGGGSMIAETLLLDDASSTGQDKILVLPQAVKNSISRITDELKHKQKFFEQQINEISKKVDEFLKTEPSPTPTIKEIQNKIKSTQEKLDRLKLGYFDIETTSEMKKELEILLQKQKEVLLEKKKSLDIKVDKQIRFVSHVQHIMSITDVSINSISKIKNDNAKIDKLGSAIKEAELKLKKLKLYEESIYKVIIPICEKMRKDMERYEKELKYKSHSALQIGKWQIQTALRDIKLQLKQLTKGFTVEEDITRCVEKIEEGMTTMLNIYETLEDYQDKAKLAAYVADINSNKALQIKTENNIELNDAIDSLNMIIKANTVLGQYKKAMTAFKYYMFPFAHLYLEMFDLPSDLKIADDINTLISSITSKLKHLKKKVRESKILLKEHDRYVHQNIDFNNRNDVTAAFYVWPHRTNKDTISKLLEGKEVIIKSDVVRGIKKNAVKFNLIRIYFKTKNTKIQDELNERLTNFAISLTHLGNSYYRCDDKFYIMRSHNQTIYYHLKWKTNGEPYNKNVVYDKISNGDFVLSPYTTWTVKLLNISSNFDTLSKYRNLDIDLELEGRGQYVDTDIGICSENLKDHYEIDDSISDSDIFNNVERKRRDLLKISERIRVEKAITKSLISDEIPAVISAKSVTSPINNIINVFKDTFSTKNSALVENFISNINYTPNYISNDNINGALILGDFVIRKITNIKQYKTSKSITNFSNIKACALSVLDEFEEILKSICGDNIFEFIEYDPVTSLSNIEKEMISGRCAMEKTFERIVNNGFLEKEVVDQIHHQVSLMLKRYYKHYIICT